MRMNRFHLLLFTLFIPIIFGGGGVLFGLSIIGTGPLEQSTSVLIAPGAGLVGTAAALKSANVIRNEWLLEGLIIATGNKNKIKAGEYAFDAHASLWQVSQKLARGEVLIRKVTFPEGWTSKQVVAALNQNEFLTGEIKDTPAEGSLMPDTYNFTRGQSRAAVLARMQKAMTDFIAANWPRHAADYPLTRPADWVKLASIVEAETPKHDERARVAGVYINRLQQNMLLEADPTVIYGLSGGAGPLGRALIFDDLKTDTAFNTYLHAGLPPTPINNPGRASLLAALTPEAHHYLYFVADGTGGHAFAENFTEHQKNVAAWRKQKEQKEKAAEAASPHSP